jgi:hypothetical protein
MLVPYFPHASWIMLFFVFDAMNINEIAALQGCSLQRGDSCVCSAVFCTSHFFPQSACALPWLVLLCLCILCDLIYIYNTHLITFIYSIVPDSGSARSCFIFYLCMQPLRPWESLNLFRLLDSFESFICFRAAGFDMLRLRLEWTKWPMFWRTAGSRWL